MAKNLKAFKKSGNGESRNGQDQSIESQACGAQIDPAKRANIESMMNEYSSKSEAELMDELMRMTSRQKKEGSFDASAMHKTAESIMPMLTPEQQQKLMGIMNMLG
ncbi:MAG: hypothetical protein IKZ82_01330 [Clostridia bacterium]|nr:hypothetical protein [Clostridia bacterium]